MPMNSIQNMQTSPEQCQGVQSEGLKVKIHDEVANDLFDRK